MNAQTKADLLQVLEDLNQSAVNHGREAAWKVQEQERLAGGGECSSGAGEGGSRNDPMAPVSI